MFNQSSILYRFKSYHLSEVKFLQQLKHRLIDIYEDKQSKIVTEDKKVENKKDKETEESNSIYSENHIFGIKKKYRRNSSCSSPWIDSELWNQICSIDTDNLPTEIKTGRVYFTRGPELLQSSRSKTDFAHEVTKSDSECISRYTTNSRRLSSDQITRFGLAAINASKILGIISTDKSKKFKLLKNDRNVRSSVISTAKSTNSGFPYFKKKNDSKCISDTEFWLNKFLSNPSIHTLYKNSVFENPTSLFHRVQPSMEDDGSASGKIRQVWCVPQRIIALEHYFFSEILQNVCQKNCSGTSSIYTSGLTDHEISKKVVQRLRNLISQEDNESLFSLDYSKYDQNIPNFAIDLFYSIIKDQLELTEKEEKCFEYLRCYTRNTPLCDGNNLYVKVKGIMSGTFITNLFDTWFNLMLWILAEDIKATNPEFSEEDFEHVDLLKLFSPLNSKYRYINHKNLGICGDDVIIYTSIFNVIIHRRICASLGMKITVGGEYKDRNDNVYFLGRFWNSDNEPFQTEKYIITHICFRTKFYSKSLLDFDISEELSVNRILSICCPLVNGFDFLKKYFFNFEPIIKFLNSNKDFTLLKEWPNDGSYRKVNRLDAFNWKKY